MAYALNEKTILKASAGVFHNRVTLNDSMLLGGNPPFQPQVSVSNGSVDNPGGVGGAAVAAVRHDGDRSGVQAPDGLHVVGRRAARDAAGASSSTRPTSAGAGCYLQRERNINQLAPGTVQANPGVNIAALRPYKGYGVIRLSENAGDSKYNSLQLGADRRYKNGFKFGARLHARPLGGQRQRQARRPVQHATTTPATGATRASTAGTCSTSITSTTCRSIKRAERRRRRRVLGGWQISGSTFMRTGTPLWVTAGRRHRRHRRHLRAAVEPGRRSRRRTPTSSSPRGAAADQNFWFNPAAFARPADGHVRQRAAQRHLQPRAVPVGHRAVQERERCRDEAQRAVPRGDLQLPEPRRTGTAPTPNPTNATFGRDHGKDNSRRDIQLSLRFLF